MKTRPAPRIAVGLPDDAWRAVESAVTDYLRFGPGELDAEYVPDELLEAALRAIRTAREASKDQSL